LDASRISRGLITLETSTIDLRRVALDAAADFAPRYRDKGVALECAAPDAPAWVRGDRTRLKLTLRGKRLGLALSEIRELIDMYEPGRDERAQLERFLAVLESHKASLLQQRADLEAQLTELQAFEKKVKKRLKRS
jgi:hypothetical protein